MAQYIYGKNVVLSRLQNEGDIEEIYLSEQFKDEKILHLVKNRVVKTMGMASLTKLVRNDNHQGVVAKIETFPFYPFEQLLLEAKQAKYPLLLVLDGVEDPHNLGAVLRTCDAVGVQGVILPKHGSASLNATVARVSTGAIEHVKVSEVTNLTRTLQRLKKEGYWVVGAEANQSRDYRLVDYKVPIVLVMGSEGKGISRLVLEQCDFKVRLPMVGHVGSLNVSVATAILLYQIYTARNPL